MNGFALYRTIESTANYIRAITLALLALATGATGHGQSANDPAVEPLIKVIKEYEQKLWGMEFNFEPWSTNCHYSKSGDVFQSATRLNADLIQENYWCRDFAVFIMQQPQSQPEPRIAGNFPAAPTNIACHWFIGVSGHDRLFFSDVIATPGTTFKVDQNEYHGQPCTRLTALVPKRGNYEFWFTQMPEPKLRGIQIVKQKGDLIGNDILGELDPKSPAGTWAADQPEMVGPWTSKVEVRSVVGPIEYTSDGFPSKLTDVFQTVNKQGKRDSSSTEMSIQVVGPTTRKLVRGRVDFATPGFSEWANGKTVPTLTRNGLLYEFRDNRLVQVVNQDALDVMNDVRFRYPAWYRSTGFYAGTTIAILSIIGILVWLRARQ